MLQGHCTCPVLVVTLPVFNTVVFLLVAFLTRRWILFCLREPETPNLSFAVVCGALDVEICFMRLLTGSSESDG